MDDALKPPMTFEQAQAAVAAMTHPRVTKESIEAEIETVDYLTHGTTTICIITIKNGFKFIGHSTPAHKANYLVDVGKGYAYDNAFRQMWPHFGFLLRQILWLQQEGYATRGEEDGSEKELDRGAEKGWPASFSGSGGREADPKGADSSGG